MELPHTIQDAAAALRAGTVSSVALTEASLAKIHALNDTVGAFIAVTDEIAMTAAKQADADFAAGVDRGPLQGVPFALKDILATKDAPTTANSLVLDRAWGEGYDSVTSERVRAAGAVLTGKLVLSEFALGMPDDEKPFPIPKNPWGLDRTAGGSSSGTGIAVSTGMVLGGIGTDTGGSVRFPAAYCGHTGLKVTYGRVPKWGVVPLGYSLDSIGPMARSAWDCAAIMNVIAGYDARDMTASQTPAPDYLDDIDGSITGLKVGVPTEYFFDHPMLDPEQKASTESVIATLKDLGAEIVEVNLPKAALAKDANTMTMITEAFAYHKVDMSSGGRWQDYGRGVRNMIARGAFYNAADYVQAQRFRSWFAKEAAKVMGAVDILVTPSIVEPAQPTANMDMSKRMLQPSYTGPFNLTGYPGLAIPSGFSSDGLPLSTQIVGAPFAEALTLKVGYAYQQVTDYHLAVPPIAIEASVA